VKIGVISDTHGFLDPRVEKIFEGVDHILHAGDIGYAALILELEYVAPVTAVVGNNDAELSFKETESIELARNKIILHHIVNPHSPSEKIAQLLQRKRPDMVVFGHTHKKFSHTVNGILYFNPGYAGKPKFGAERSVAIVDIDQEGIRHKFIPL
jgi:putative phosphoesterase